MLEDSLHACMQMSYTRFTSIHDGQQQGYQGLRMSLAVSMKVLYTQASASGLLALHPWGLALCTRAVCMQSSPAQPLLLSCLATLLCFAGNTVGASSAICCS